MLVRFSRSDVLVTVVSWRIVGVTLDTSSCSVRAATPDDAADLHALAALTFPLACPPHTRPDDVTAFIAEHLSESALRRYVADPQRVVVVAEAASGLCGWAMLVLGEPTDPDVAAALTARPTAEVSKLYVHPGHHGAGTSAALMTRMLEAARERGAVAVWLGVNQLNARANRFYEKQGFRQVGVKRFLVGQRWEDDFVRERVLG